MKFYREKIKDICRQKKIGLGKLALRMNITRTTLWFWQMGKIVPSEKKVRLLATELGVPVNEISDLNPYTAIIDKDGTPGMDEQAFSLWMSYGDKELLDRKSERLWHISKIEKQLDDADQLVSTLRSLVNFADVMLYAKDVSHRYTVVSKAFLSSTNYKSEEAALGKTDEDFFPGKESVMNKDEDEMVMKTGTLVKSREGIIPGTRRKKWGLISKIPTYDAKGRITGLIGSFIDITQRIEAEKTSFLTMELLKRVHDAVFWIGKGSYIDNNGLFRIREFIYSNFSRMLEMLPEDARNLPMSEIEKYIFSLRTEETRKNSINLSILKEQGYHEAEWALKLPPTGKIQHFKNKVYYLPREDVYLGIVTSDVLADNMNEMKLRISEKLRHLGVSGSVIRKAFAPDKTP